MRDAWKVTLEVLDEDEDVAATNDDEETNATQLIRAINIDATDGFLMMYATMT